MALTPCWLQTPNRSHVSVPPDYLKPLWYNCIAITPKVSCTVSELAMGLLCSFQQNAARFPPFLVCYKGSFFTKLVLPEYRIGDYDLDILFFLGEEDHISVMNMAAQVINGFFHSFVSTRSQDKKFLEYKLNPCLYNGSSGLHGITRLTVGGVNNEYLPLDLTVHTLNPRIKSLSYHQLESFFMPVESNFLYSECNGEVNDLICDIQTNRVLRVETGAQKASKFSFYRLQRLITELGVTSVSLDLYTESFEVDSQIGQPLMLEEMKKYIRKKKKNEFFWPYLVNSLFHCPPGHKLFPDLAEACLATIANEENTIGEASSQNSPTAFHEIIVAYREYSAHLDSTSKGLKFLCVLKFLIPLFSEKAQITRDGGMLFLLCKNCSLASSAYLLVPLLQKGEKEELVSLFSGIGAKSSNQALMSRILKVITKQKFPLNNAKFLSSEFFSLEELGLLFTEGKVVLVSAGEVESLFKQVIHGIQVKAQGFFTMGHIPQSVQKMLLDLSSSHAHSSLWKALFVQLVFSLSRGTLELSQKEKSFLSTIEKRASPFSQGEYGAVFYLYVLSLLGHHSIYIQRLLEEEQISDSLETVTTCLQRQADLDPLCFLSNLENLLYSNELDKAQKLIRYQEAVIRPHVPLEGYRQIFAYAIANHKRSVAFCFLQKLYSASEDYFQYLSNYYCTFSSPLKFLRAVLQKTPELAWPLYRELRTVPNVADMLEKEYLLGSNSSVDRSVTAQDLVCIKEKEWSFEQRISLLRLAARYVPEVLEELFLEWLPHFHDKPEIHADSLVVFQMHKDSISTETIDRYGFLFIDQLSMQKHKKSNLLDQQGSAYLGIVSDKCRFTFANMDCRLLKKDVAEEWFALALNRSADLPMFLENYDWKPESVSRWLSFIRQNTVQTKEQRRFILLKLAKLLLCCNRQSLTAEEVDTVFEIIPYLVELLLADTALKQEERKAVLALPLTWLSTWPSKSSLKLTCGCIRQVVEAYADDIGKLPNSLWKDFSRLVALAPKEEPRKKPWNILLVSRVVPYLAACYGNIHLEDPIASFVGSVAHLAGPEHEIETNQEYALQVLLLFGPTFADPRLMLKKDLDSSSIEKIQPYLDDRMFDTFLKENQLRQAMRWVEYKQTLLDSHRLKAYHQIFSKSLQEKNSLIALAILQILFKYKSSTVFARMLATYHKTFLQDKTAFRSFLDRKRDLIAPFYSEIVSAKDSLEKILIDVENDYLMIYKEAASSSSSVESMQSYEAAILSRIKFFALKGKTPSSFLLSRALPTEKIVTKEAFEIFCDLFEKSSSEEERIEAALLVHRHFPSLMDVLLLRFTSLFREDVSIHFVLDKLSSDYSIPISAQVLQACGELFIKHLSEISHAHSKKNILKIAQRYYAVATDEHKAAFAYRCIALPLTELTQALFVLATSCQDSIIDSLSKETWTWDLVQKWLHFFAGSAKTKASSTAFDKERYIAIVLNTLEDFGSQEAKDILSVLDGHLTDSLEDLIQEKLKKSRERCSLSLLTHPAVVPILAKDQELYTCFLEQVFGFTQKIIEGEIEGVESKTTLKTLVKLVQQIDYFGPFNAELEEKRFETARACVKLLSEYPNSLVWMAKQTAERIEDSNVRMFSVKLIELSPKSVVTLFPRFATTLNPETDGKPTLLLVKDYLSALAKASLTREDLVDIAPGIRTVADYLIRLTHAWTQNQLIAQSQMGNLDLESDAQLVLSAAATVGQCFARQPYLISKCGQKVVDLLSQYQGNNKDLWYEKNNGANYEDTPMKIIENMLFNYYIPRLKIIAFSSSKVPFLADLSVYTNYLHKVFITREIQPNLQSRKPGAFFLSYDELMGLVERAKQTPSPLQASVETQLVETLLTICSGDIRNTQIIDLSFVLLGINCYKKINSHRSTHSEFDQKIQELFVFINSLAGEGTSIWTFRQACIFLLLYKEFVAPESAVETFTSVPKKGLPNNFVLVAITRACKILYQHIKGLIDTEEKVLEVDLRFLCLCCYLASEHSQAAKNGKTILFPKEVPVQLINIVVNMLLPSNCRGETLQKILNAIHMEERNKGITTTSEFTQKMASIRLGIEPIVDSDIDKFLELF